ncbi:hypothetical protein GF342_05845, partial [Candidatus Woesearchaeota archaeon]|nr:hypothetical protein [Candidatus Woesearchaeota archaeon]
MISLQTFRDFEPLEEWFLHNPRGLHGITHEARVLILAELLGKKVHKNGKHVDMDVLRWTSMIHDTQRTHDGVCHEHGARA